MFVFRLCKSLSLQSLVCCALFPQGFNPKSLSGSLLKVHQKSKVSQKGRPDSLIVEQFTSALSLQMISLNGCRAVRVIWLDAMALLLCFLLSRATLTLYLLWRKDFVSFWQRTCWTDKKKKKSCLQWMSVSEVCNGWKNNYFVSLFFIFLPQSLFVLLLKIAFYYIYFLNIIRFYIKYNWNNISSYNII